MTTRHPQREGWKQWFARQCTDNFGQWSIGLLVAGLSGGAATVIAAGAWCQSAREELIGLRHDMNHLSDGLKEYIKTSGEDSKDQWNHIWEDHDAIAGVGERVSRLEGATQKAGGG